MSFNSEIRKHRVPVDDRFRNRIVGGEVELRVTARAVEWFMWCRQAPPMRGGRIALVHYGVRGLESKNRGADGT